MKEAKIMNKKYLITGIACIFLLISGVLYSCSYQEKSSAVLISDKEDSEQSSHKNQINIKSSLESRSISDSGKATESTEQAEKTEYVDFATEIAVEDNSIHESAVNSEKLSVHICGAVKSPGVYETEGAARVCDLIELAGGLREDAAGDFINQAQKVTDGQRIYIPTKEELKDQSPLDYSEPAAGIQQTTENKASSGTGSDTKLININTATAEILMELPGVGEAKAAAIIEYRTANGGFQSITDIMKISGIKEGLFHKIEKYITVQ
jgi:competence protein ComEA